MPVCSYMSKAIKWCRPTVLIALKPMIAMIGKPMISDFFFFNKKKKEKKGMSCSVNATNSSHDLIKLLHNSVSDNGKNRGTCLL